MIDNKKYLNKINYALAKKQNLTSEQLSKLEELYSKKDEIQIELKKAKKREDILAKTVEWTKIEYEIQDNWNFERNYDYHRFWKNPHCKCPHLDNEDRWGINEKIISLSCPIHSNKEFMTKIRSLEMQK